MNTHPDSFSISMHATIRLLLILSLFPLAFCAAALASNPPLQTISLNPVQKEVSAYAIRHVAAGAPMQTSLVVALFKDSFPNVSSQAIAIWYETAYITEQARLKRLELSNFFHPNLGWVTAFILLFILITKDALKSGLKSAFKSLIKTLYYSLHSRRIFSFLAIRQYKKHIIYQHSHLQIAFRPDKPLKMSEIFVPLRFLGDRDSTDVEAGVAMKKYRRIMILGRPGSGKSMLLRNLILSYANNTLQGIEDCPISVLLELHRLNSASFNIENHIQEELGRAGLPLPIESLRLQLKEGGLLLLFDGLDEVKTSMRPEVSIRIRDFLHSYPNCRFICTCREAIYRHELDDCTDKRLEVADFSDYQIRRFLRSWAPSMPPEKSVEQLMQALRDRPQILALSRNPLLLTIIAYLYTDTPFILPHSRPAFYEKSTQFLLDQWHHEHNRFNSAEKGIVLQSLALLFQARGLQQGEDRRTMDRQIVINEVRDVLPSLSRNSDDLGDILQEIVERSGLLISIDGGERFAFAHLTLQEFFAAKALEQKEPELLLKYSKDPDAWREVIKLWCGLVSDSTNMINAILAADEVTAFECLADAQSIEPRVTQALIFHFKAQIESSVDLHRRSRLTQAAGLLAADTKPRGRDIFLFLKSLLVSGNTYCKEVGAESLSRTNTPEAADELALRYSATPWLRSALVRMGDVAVPRLLDISRSHRMLRALALEDLRIIGTPHAACGLAEFLWSEEIELASAAAWHLAALVGDRDIEDALREITSPRKRSDYDWVPLPFKNHLGENLSRIFSRISELVDRPPVPDRRPDRIDYRISVALCATRDSISQLEDRIVWSIENRCRENITDDFELFLRELGVLEGRRAALEVIKAQSEFARQRITGIDAQLDIRRRLHDLSQNHNSTEHLRRVADRCVDEYFDDVHWKLLFRSIHPRLQYPLFLRLLRKPQPTTDDWTNVFKPIEYEFSRGWHFKLFLTVASVFTLVFAFGISCLYKTTLLPPYTGITLIIATSCAMVFIWISLFKILFSGSSQQAHHDFENKLKAAAAAPLLAAPAIAIVLWKYWTSQKLFSK